MGNGEWAMGNGQWGMADGEMGKFHGSGAVGLAAALGLAHVLRALLYQTSTHDKLAFVAVPVVLCLVAGAAVLLPARAGMKVEPTVALRYE